MEIIKKNPGGAPKKADKDKKGVVVSVRFKPDEVQWLDNQAKTLNKTRSKVVHDGALNLTIQPPITIEQYERAGDVARLSSNINQCAKRLAEIKHIISSLSDGQSVGFDWHKEDIHIETIEQLSLKAQAQVDALQPLLQEIRDLLLYQYEGN